MIALRGRRWRRFLRVIAALLVVIVGLHTPPAKRTVAALLANALSSAFEMSVSVPQLDYQLWNGTATLGDVRVSGPQLNASSRRVEAQFGPRSGLRVRVFEPRVRMTANQSRPAKTLEANDQPWTSLLRVAAAEIIGGSMRYTGADGSAPVELDGIDVLLSRTGNGLGGSVHVDSASIAAGVRIERISADARIEVTADGALIVSSARLRATGIDLEVDGELRHVNPLAMQARFSGVIDPALVSAAGPQSPLTISGSHPIRVRGRLENDQLLADALEVEMFGGALTGRGTARLADRGGELAITMRNVDAAAVMLALGSPVAIASRVDADVAVRIRDWNPELLNGSGVVEFRSQQTRGVPVIGAVRVAINGRTISGVAERLTIRDAAVRLDAKAVVGGEVAARYSLQVPAVERLPVLLADMGITASAGPLTGSVAVEGTIAGRVPELVSAARVSSENIGAYGVQTALDASVRITRQNLEIVSLNASGDRVDARARGFIPLTSTGHWQLSGDVTRFDLADVLAGRGIAATAVTSGSFSVDGARSNPTMRIALDTDVADTAIGAEHASLHTIAHVSLSGVVLERATGTGAGGTLAMSGSWKPDGDAIEGRLQADRIDLRRLPGFTTRFRDITSAMSMTGEIAGALSAPSGRAHVNLADTRFRDVELGTVRFDVTADGRDMDLSGTIGGRAFVSGRGSVVSPWPVDLTVDLAALPLAEVVRAIPLATPPISDASLVGHADIRLSLGEPASFDYESEISSASIRVAREWRAASFSIAGDRNQIQIRGLELRSGDSRVAVDGALGIEKPSGTMTVAGHAQLAELAPLVSAIDGAGQADIDMRIGGSMASPMVAGKIVVRDGALQGARVKIEAIQIEAIAEDSVFSIKTATARVSGGEVRLTGALPLVSQVGAAPRQLQFTIRGLDLATVTETSASGSDLSVPIDLDGHVTLSGLTLDAIDAAGVLTRMAVVAGTDRHDLDAPVSWTFARGALAHTPLRLRGAKGDMTVATSLNVSNGDVQFGATGTGTVDLSIANSFLAGVGVVGGTLTFDAKLSRTAGRWTVGGGATVSDGRVVLKSPQLALTDLRATLRADGDRIELTDATAAMGDGKIVADGTATIIGTDVDVNVRVTADRVPLEYPEGLRTRSSGEIRITGTTAASRVTGDLVVHRAVYEREIDLTAQALDSAAAIVGGINEPQSPLARTELALTLRLEEGLRIATTKATVVIDGAMRITGTAASPELDGSLGIREGGTVRVSRALVRLQGGRIELRGYPARPAEIDIKGVTQVTGVRIDVGLSGSLDDVRMSLSSSNRTDLSQGDLAALILTGRTTTDAAADSGAVVVEELAAALGQRLDRGLGGPLMIDVSRDESLIVEDTDPSQRLNIGVPLNNRLYVIYSRSLDREALRWIVDFRPGGDFRVRGISNDDGSEAIEVSHRFGFDAWSRKYRVPRAKEATLKIGRVTVSGAPGQTEAELRSRLKLKTGEAFDYFRGEEAAKRARDRLVEEGFLTAAVDVSEARRDNELDLAVRIDAGPRITIEWRGDDAGRGERKYVNAGWGTFLPLQETAAQLARDVRNRLRARGYYNAVVTAEVQSNAGESHAVFNVRRGPKGNGVTLVFEGNASIPRSTLAALVPKSDRPEFFELLDVDRAQKVPTAIRMAYAREGFLQVHVGASVARVDPLTNRLLVTIPIQEGTRATIRAFDLPSELTTITGTVEPNFQLRPGDHFRLDAYNADRTRLMTWYRDEGFADARVHGVVEPTAGGVVVRLRAEPGPRVLLGSVRAARDSHTRESVIDGAVGLNPGDIVRARDLDQVRERLSETRIFRSVDVRLEPSAADGGTRDVVVDVSERTDINTEYSLRYTTAGSSEVSGSPSESEAGLQVGGAAELVNPFGWAARYRIYALYGAERRLFGARYESATFFGRRWETQVFLFDDRDRVEDIEVLGERVQGLTFQQTKRWRTALDGRRLHDRVRLQWGYTFKLIRYRDLETGDTLGGHRAGPILSLVSDSRDSVTDPHRGVFWSVGTETALRAVGSDVNYLKVFGQLFFYTSLTPRITWAQSFRIGAVPGTDPLLLLERRFTAGGASSVRGFEEKGLGPTGPNGEMIGGQAMAVFNQELRFPLWKRLFGGVFYDAGNAFLLAGDLDLGALRHSAGAGLRLMFPFGPVRFDWSGVINPQADETRSRVLFSIGHVF